LLVKKKKQIALKSLQIQIFLFNHRTVLRAAAAAGAAWLLAGRGCCLAGRLLAAASKIQP